jgi:dTDP-4-dehydrorhamnose 3,5-epimerase
MRFTETKMKGTYIIELERREDNRGFFARSWCQNEFQAHGLHPSVVQINVGYTVKRAGLRGLHYQVAPHEEAKTVRCTRGAVFDVAVDLRADSLTYKQWVGVELTLDNRRMLYIPEGCAHGYQTLADDTEIEYLTTAFYAPESARGARFDDPVFRISWPLPVGIVSDADRSWPDFKD